MNKTSIYLKCPGCKEISLLIEAQGKCFCANCMYDYTLLKSDPGKLDEVLVENMKGGGFSALFASALYQKVALVSPQEAITYIQTLAQANGLKLYPSKTKKLSGKGK
ncbi:MAG: hypothetical protein AAGU74_06460 [Bacillota bacterium]